MHSEDNSIVPATSGYISGTAALETVAAGRGWLEIFHSAPTWADALITYRLPDSTPSDPPVTRRLIDAPERPGFRVFRVQLRTFYQHQENTKVRFRLRPSDPATPGVPAVTYICSAEPGRYVVTAGRPDCTKVAPPDIPQCLRAYRPRDGFVEITFTSGNNWKVCEIALHLHGQTESLLPNISGQWSRQRMRRQPAVQVVPAIDDPLPDKTKEMFSSETGSKPVESGHPVVSHSLEWFSRFKCNAGLDCVFTDGNDVWDNNNGTHYIIPMPGQYTVGAGVIHYQGPALLDRHVVEN